MKEVRRRYCNVLMDDNYEYTLEFSREKMCSVSITGRSCRALVTKEVFLHGGRWQSDSFQLSPALQWCIMYYYEQWEVEHDLAFVGIETAAAKKLRIAEEVSKLTSQELELDKGF